MASPQLLFLHGTTNIFGAAERVSYGIGLMSDHQNNWYRPHRPGCLHRPKDHRAARSRMKYLDQFRFHAGTLTRSKYDSSNSFHQIRFPLTVLAYERNQFVMA